MTAAQTTGTAPATAIDRIPEIQGLRTVALVLVVSFHVWSGGLSGGVDIFLLVSAYLMTRSLTAAAEAGGGTRALTVIVRRLARIVPVAAVTAALTLAAVWLLLPMRTWSGAGDDAVASVTYWMNVHLQQVQTDYYDLDRHSTTPFQQFWSLSIQAQVFVAWPLLHLATEWVARRRGWPVRRVLVGAFAAIGAASFAWAIVSTAEQPELAYFDTGARLWEFAAGSLLALVQPWIRLPDRLRPVLAWIGLAGVVSCGLVLPDDARFPGLWALWPVLSAALIIASAGSTSRVGAGRLLGNRLLGVVGGYTYALYLVHWPIYILWVRVEGREVVGPLAGAAVLAVSTVAAVLLTHLVDRPIARWVRGRSAPHAQSAAPREASAPVAAAPPRRAARRRGQRARRRGLRRAGVALAATVLPVLVAVPGADAVVADRREASATAVAEADYSALGAQAPQGRTQPPLLPADLIARQIWTDSGEPCGDDDPARTVFCFVTGDAATAAREIVVLGNSHSMHYNGMLLETAEQHDDWSVRTQVAAGCTMHIPDEVVDDCDAVWALGTDYVLEHEPDLVIVLGSLSLANASDMLYTDLPGWIETVTASGDTQVVALRDTPRFDFVPYECADALGFDLPDCFGQSVPPGPDLEAFADAVEAAGGIWVDLNDVICPDGTCRPSMGGVVTYVDTSHITESFSRSLAEHFTQRVTGRIPWWPDRTFDDA